MAHVEEPVFIIDGVAREATPEERKVFFSDFSLAGYEDFDALADADGNVVGWVVYG